MTLQQTPSPGSLLLHWRCETLVVTLTLDTPQPGRAVFRTNLGHAAIERREIIDETERGLTPLARAWSDVPMEETSPGVYTVAIPLQEVGIFAGKACFFPAGTVTPLWPEGENVRIKVVSAETRARNSIYCVFPRQFGSFREVVRRLPFIMDEMGFRIIQTLPPFPVPTTYAVMGEYGCPFAATDFFSVDPALAEFDEFRTPLGQFKEFVGAVHAKGGLFFIDLPANHTGWASALQTHHPEWFHHEADGRFHSPGAWGVKWADLVALDYVHAGLRAYMAEVFLFWCRRGVDGFRCDAGYMIPAATWAYIVARVREEYPDTVFFLEGLGGELSVTDQLLTESNLDWAYSEIFQTFDRGQFEWYLPTAIARAESRGTLVHFAETHDNDRLAKGGPVYAQLRVKLAALLSWQGAWGIANGVEWYCTEKIDVHGKNALNWGASENMVALIARLNALLATHPSFSGACHLALITRGGGNTLAVVRQQEGQTMLLVLANLDCGQGVEIQWDRAVFGASHVRDLLTATTLTLGDSLWLEPGEVRCLEDLSRAAVVPACSPEPIEETAFHVVMPRDAARQLVVPAGVRLTVSAETAFRLRLVDPLTGRTLKVRRSRANRVVLTTPEYVGDGSRCRALNFDVTRYVEGRAVRTHAHLLIPPAGAAARARLVLTGDEVRAAPETRAILSNGAGAAAQVRLGWGRVVSQYDALLAANPNPTVPSDRLNLWTRTRCWLQLEGYLRELDAKSLSHVTVDPAGRFVRWGFRVPCGMGREAAFSFVLSLVLQANAARLSVTRTSAGANDPGVDVRLVFRPDLEWRSFHATTKAYQGAEERFPRAVRTVGEEGFDFAPYEGTFSLRVRGGAYHPEAQWTYGLSHSEEAARGQEASGDVFSPGWISADLPVGGQVELRGFYAATAAAAEPAWDAAVGEEIPDDFPPLVPLDETLRRALDLFIVRRDDLKTVIAGYPWFLDWGRDTFIFLRGMIAAGRVEESLAILRAFAAFEEKGTLPNIIYGQTAGNRDTTDAQLWFIRCVQELVQRGVDVGTLTETCTSIVTHYISGTPNGIHMDAASALVWSPSHFTWMDTNYPACTPRVGYPVEIQALWISALRFVGRTDLAEQAKESVRRLFAWAHGFRDCLAAPNGEPAERATPEDTIRPNQLFLVTLDVLVDPAIVRATEELVVPGGMRSLNALHPLYRGRYEGDEDTSRKPAYHNGTVWAWTFPMYAEALVKTGLASRETARSLLASAVENLNTGCLGHLSENADGDAPHAQKGCCAQAWSDSELLRVWLSLAT